MTSNEKGVLLHPMIPFRGLKIGGEDNRIGSHSARPRGEKAVVFVTKFANLVDKYVSKCGDTAAETLGYLVSNMLPDRACVAFRQRHPKTLGNCLELFRSFEFPLEQMHGFSCDGTKRKSPERSWLKEWGLSWRCNVENQAGRDRVLKTPGEWVVLEPTISDGEDDPSGTHWKNRCLRNVLVMAAIRFGKLNFETS
jgi:hypothetical protein